MIGNVFSYLARHFLTDAQITARFSLRGKTPVSKHANQRTMKRGRCYIAANSSFMKRMRSPDGFADVKISPARRREHWSATKRWMWAEISNLVTDLAKDRERRRMMRLAA